MIKQINLFLENYGISNFLFYKVTNDREVAIDQIDTLKNSHIPGLLPCLALERDGEIFIRYDLVSGRNWDMMFGQPISKDQLQKCLLHSIETFNYAEKQGLKVENFVLDYHYIYIDHFSGRPLFVYLPIHENQLERITYKEFFLRLMSIAPYDEGDDIHFFIKTHNYLVGIKELDLQEFSEKLQTFAVETTQPSADFDVTNQNEKFYRPGSTERKGVTSDVKNEGMITSQYNRKKFDKKIGPKLEIEEEVQYKRITRTEFGEKESILAGGTSINISPSIGPNISIDKDNNESEGTTVLGAYGVIDEEDEGTTALGVANHMASRPFILALVNHEKIIITKDVFKIGRDPKQTDYSTDNKVVGRVHAQLVTESGAYFLEDNHSTNGSYVNHIKLGKGERVKIKHDDQIKLANEEFLFKLF
ncbi:FHA domain-containing protein [Neobacillus niacini]|uniref:FHA domain-containing protein n=1 Tax=Neobacillus niacini TaxID=86668 RepID=UPI002FFF68B0